MISVESIALMCLTCFYHLTPGFIPAGSLGYLVWFSLIRIVFDTIITWFFRHN